MLKQLTPDQVQIIILAALRAREAARRFWSGKPLPFGDVAEALPAHDFTDADTAPLAHAEEVVAFRRLLAELSHGARAELMALAWLGCGECDPPHWEQAVKRVGKLSDDHVIEVLAATSPLPEYLGWGLNILSR
jgi:hypothetical protein